jgi:LysM repeat protein
MKKFLVLIAVAVVVGIAISRSQDSEPGGQPDEQASPAPPAKSERGEKETPSPEPPMRLPGKQAEPGGQERQKAPEGSPTREKKQADRPRQGKSTPAQSEKPTAPIEPPPASATTNVGQEVERKPTSPQKSSVARTASAALSRGITLARSGREIQARELLTGLYLKGSAEVRRKARKALRTINKELVFNPRVRAGATIHTVEPGETLGKIGRKHGVNWRMIQIINGISRPGLIRVGQKLKVLTGPRRILVDKSDFRLALLIDGDFIKEYPVGLGKNNETPTGTFEVGQMLIEPDWYPPWGGVIKYGEEGHLIGDRWIGLADQPGVSGYGIHGTSDPDSIGTLCSNGCIRMHNEDVKELYAFVNSGTTVEIVE